ncbi:MAG: PilT/PilU family type 4a pilus ATPase [Candidatus Gracilibacteria bacterium]|nr:PilT/PilU family type 4a pilus ATPase [Candidatus Gracilibacteria bacterium]MDD2908896.1 PilT/PilU family type 4a pilus ATPase [Candidatus Gracilibacteria bacterium]
MVENVITPNFSMRDSMLRVMIDNKGSDFYYTVGTYPGIKVSGELILINEGIEKLTPKDTSDFAKSLVTQEQWDQLHQTHNLDFAFSFQGSRFRGNVSFQMQSIMIVLRLLSDKIPSLQDLDLPLIYREITKLGQGLVLITGPTGSGKSTTLAAMINEINEKYAKHIITIEDPIEYMHPHKMSIVEQKEIGKDVPDYRTALIGAMRQNPQVILFGEMRSTEEIEMALTLAETGHLVFSTLHTKSATQTVSRIIDSFPAGQQNQVRLQLADTLAGVFSQRLLRKSDGSGIRMVKEILIKNTAVSNLIRENELHQLPSMMQISGKEGMQILEQDLLQYINEGDITLEEGLKYANNPKFLKDNVRL